MGGDPSRAAGRVPRAARPTDGWPVAGARVLDSSTMSPPVLHRAPLSAGLLLAGLLAAGCGAEGRADGGAEAGPADDPAVEAVPASHQGLTSMVVVEGLLNGGFEMTADATTSPPKAGAYWVGAYSTEPGVPDDLVEERQPDAPDAAAEGRRFLRLPVGRRVSQKIVADIRAPLPQRVEMDLRVPAGVDLDVILEDGSGRTLTMPDGGADIVAGPGERGHGWTRRHFDFAAQWGRDSGRSSGHVPRPRLWLHLQARPQDHLDPAAAAGLSVDVDAVTASIGWELVSEADMRARIEDLVVWQLETWLLPRPAEGVPEGDGPHGLGLVDPDSGYVRVTSYDIETGQPLGRARTASFHTIHRLLIQWLQHCERAGRDEEAARWRPHLARIVTTMLDNNFDPGTGLPRNVTWPELRPMDDTAVTVGSFVEFLLDARPLLHDAELQARILAACRRVADTLIVLQRRHDLDPDRHENTWRLDEAGVVLIGDFDNWYGHIPNKLTPKGVIDTPRRFNTAWAVVTRRAFWYHVFKSSAAIMAVHELDPRDGDVEAVHRVVSLYERAWDAHRYQLENDTDDHYGYLCEDVLAILRHSDGELTDALALVQQATDHRLERDGRPLGDTLWINGIRLGTPCAGDSPRAIKGLLDLYSLPPELNPATSGLPLYRDAILELAANDWKGRQLTNGQFTESFFKHWEMVCICFRGNVQDDCRHPPPEGWHGDVGDTFGGPPGSSIDAQVWAYAVADGPGRTALRGRLSALMHVTETDLRRRFGYLHGLDEAVARQYELPDKYILGLSGKTAAGLGTVVAWARLLPELSAD